MKSEARKELEQKIRDSHRKSFNIASQMLEEEYGGDEGKAISDKAFIERVHAKVKEFWQEYLQGYRDLEELERKEGYQGIFNYAEYLDSIAEHLPAKCRKVCHYPFSGVDLYWARIFDKTIFEEINFGGVNHHPQIWWDFEMYDSEKREGIVNLLRGIDVIPSLAELVFLAGDAHDSRLNNQFNNSSTTLLIKGGHDVLDYIDRRFKDEALEYGAIITVCSANSLEEMEERFSQDGYQYVAFLNGADFIVPYAMELREVHVFLK